MLLVLPEQKLGCALTRPEKSCLVNNKNPAFMDSRQPYLKQEEYDNYIKKLGITN